MLIPQRKQPGFFCLPLSPLHILLMVTFPKLRKTSARRESASRNFGKSQYDEKVFPETSENLSATEKCFPKLRKVPMRRESASRNFGKPQCGGKVLPETSENPNAAGKCFPKLRKTPMRRKSASRNFGKFQCGGKVLPETSESPNAAEKLLSVLRTAYLQTFIRKIHFYQAGICIRRICHQCLPNPTGSVRIFCHDI